MGARRPKPTQLKEPTQARPNIAISRLFASANALVEVPRHELPPNHVSNNAQDALSRSVKDALSRNALKSVEVEAAALEPTRTLRIQTQVSAVAQDSDAQRSKPSAEHHKSSKPSAEHHKSLKPSAEHHKSLKPSAEHHKSLKPSAQQKRVKNQVTMERRPIRLQAVALPLFLASLTLLIFAYGLGMFDGVFSSPSWDPHRIPGASAAKRLEQRLAFHRDITGTRLNRERIDVQIQNFKTAPALNGADRKTNVPTMMEGLPLTEESNVFTRDAKSDLVADPTFSEAKVGYGLQEEQYRAEFEQRAEKAWVHDFVENARRGGYDVQIDAHGNVKAKPINE